MPIIFCTTTVTPYTTTLLGASAGPPPGASPRASATIFPQRSPTGPGWRLGRDALHSSLSALDRSQATLSRRLCGGIPGFRHGSRERNDLERSMLGSPLDLLEGEVGTSCRNAPALPKQRSGNGGWTSAILMGRMRPPSVRCRSVGEFYDAFTWGCSSKLARPAGENLAPSGSAFAGPNINAFLRAGRPREAPTRAWVPVARMQACPAATPGGSCVAPGHLRRP